MENNNSEKDYFEEYYKELENLINKNDGSLLSVHASISGYKFYWAREQINSFFENEDIRMLVYGSSSSDMRSHNLFRHSNGKIYVVHHSYGEWSDWFPLTGSEISQYFNDQDSTIDDMHPKTKEFVEIN